MTGEPGAIAERQCVPGERAIAEKQYVTGAAGKGDPPLRTKEGLSEERTLKE